jgi:hypothetical protein
MIPTESDMIRALRSAPARKKIFFVILFAGITVMLLLAVKSGYHIARFMDHQSLNRKEHRLTMQIHAEIDSWNAKISDLKAAIMQLNSGHKGKYGTRMAEDFIHDAINRHNILLAEIKTVSRENKGSGYARQYQISCNASFGEIWKFLSEIEDAGHMRIVTLRLYSEKNDTEKINMILVLSCRH